MLYIWILRSEAYIFNAHYFIYLLHLKWSLDVQQYWDTVGFLDVFSLSVVKLHCSSWEVKKCSEEKLRHDENIFIFCFMLFFLFFMSYESCPFISQFSWYLVAGMWQIIYLSSVLPLPVNHISFTFLVINYMSNKVTTSYAIGFCCRLRNWAHCFNQLLCFRNHHPRMMLITGLLLLLLSLFQFIWHSHLQLPILLQPPPWRASPHFPNPPPHCCTSKCTPWQW